MTKKAATDQVQQFEAAMKDLESIVSQMESGSMSLEESLGAYEKGIALFRQCQSMLEQAQQRVQLLSDPSKENSAQPFADLED